MRAYLFTKPGVVEKLRGRLPILGTPLKHPSHEGEELVPFILVYKALDGLLQTRTLRARPHRLSILLIQYLLVGINSRRRNGQYVMVIRTRQP